MLVKMKLSFLALSTAVVAFWLASKDGFEFGLLVCFSVGTFLVIAGTNAFNQVLEREQDALMHRTANRPLPAKRMDVSEALIVAILISMTGLLLLVFTVNTLTSFLAALALINYVVVYTPLKCKSPWCTFIGAVSGAIPPVMGWTVVRNEINLPAWVLFAILFLWQLPHFWAIAWVYREDYARAGFKVLSVIDLTGYLTGRLVVAYCLALLIVSPMLTIMGLTGTIYFFCALLLNLMLLGYGIKLWLERSRHAANQLMGATFLYLPLLLILMAVDKTI